MPKKEILAIVAEKIRDEEQKVISINLRNLPEDIYHSNDVFKWLVQEIHEQLEIKNSNIKIKNNIKRTF